MAREPSVRLTYEDYLHFPDDGRRWELIDGEAYVTPAPTTRHQTVVGRLFRRVANHLEAFPGGTMFVAPVEVRLAESDVVQPDLVYVADTGIITPERIDGVPTWLVEVLSDPHRDRHLKRQQYERFGVPHYWIVDPDQDTVEIYRLEDDRYGRATVRRPPDAIELPFIPGLRIDLTDLLARSD